MYFLYVLAGKPVNDWGASLIETLPKVKDYVIAQGRYVKENLDNWCVDYVNTLNIL